MTTVTSQAPALPLIAAIPASHSEAFRLLIGPTWHKQQLITSHITSASFSYLTTSSAMYSSQTCYMSCPSHYPWFVHPKICGKENALWSIVELYIVKGRLINFWLDGLALHSESLEYNMLDADFDPVFMGYDGGEKNSKLSFFGNPVYICRLIATVCSFEFWQHAVHSCRRGYRTYTAKLQTRSWFQIGIRLRRCIWMKILIGNNNHHYSYLSLPVVWLLH